MEKNNAIGDMEKTKNLIYQLRQGRELAHQLRNHLSSSSSSSPETKEFLAQMILSTYEKSITMLSSGDAQQTMLVRSPDSRGVESPNSEDSNQDLKDATQKRKKMLQWRKQVRVSNGVGQEGPLDGFSWRKYGQKDILGAKFPRGYYRCSHKLMQGCPATKQVQRSDQDPTIFKITYRGSHTCTRAPNSIVDNPLTENQEPNDSFDIEQNQQDNDFQVPQELENVIKQVQRSDEDPTILKITYQGSHTCTQAPNSNLENPLTEIQEPSDTFGIGQNQQNSDLANAIKDLRVITQDLDVHGQNQNPNQELLCLPSSSATRPEKSEFMTHLVDSRAMFLENFASGANYGFPTSPSFGSANFTSSAENVHEVVSATTSASNSPTLGFDFPFGNMGLDSDFTFGNPGGFSS